MLVFSSKPRSPRSRRQHSSNGTNPGLAPLAQPPAAIGEPIDFNLPGEAPVRNDWHDSSVELKHGLDVTEDVPLDTLPPELLEQLAPPRR